MPDPSSNDVQVLIVGLGPTGAALAGLLGQRGVRTVVFDKLPQLFPLPRAIGMDHEVMRIAQELNIDHRLGGLVEPYRPSEYRGVEGQIIKRLDSPPPPHRLGWDPMFVFNQPAFETVLRERLEDLPAVTVSVETEVIGFGQDADGAWVDVLEPGAEGPQRVRGDYLVACDGGASQVRTELGITMTDLGFHENWLVIDVLIEDDATLARLPQTQVQYCEPWRPATFVCLVGRHRRWEIALEPGELPAGPIANDDVWPWLERWIKPKEASIWRAAAYTFRSLVADEWRRGRILLAGDAGHMTPPFMAQGMAAGMRDAQNLAWKLDAVLTGRADDRLLDTYQEERRPHTITTTQHAIALGRVICEKDEAAARARDQALLAPHPGDVPVTFRSEFLPPLTDGLFAFDTPGAGELFPQPVVFTGDVKQRLDDVIGPGFCAVASSSVGIDDVMRLDDALAPLGGRAVRVRRSQDRTLPTRDGGDVVECDDLMTEWLASLDRSIAIARPDHGVYGTAATADEALDLLNRIVSSYGTANSAAETG
jgi:3-(3-hydroxy-phenyl)propionate hydroxylase